MATEAKILSIEPGSVQDMDRDSSGGQWGFIGKELAEGLELASY